MPFTSFRLTNGLTLRGLPRPGSGTVSLALVLPIGGRHDPARLLGLAHMVEHMVFCGTRRWSETQLRDEIEQRGGLWQGRTSHESTAYFVHLPAGELAFGLRALQQLVFAPIFPPQALLREKSIIAREAAPETSPLARRLRFWFLQLGIMVGPEELSRHLLFAGTGLEQPIIGFAETRRRITLEDVRAYHARWYHPARAQLLAVGDFAWPELQTRAQRTLGGLPPGEANRPSAIPPRRALRQRRFQVWTPLATQDLKQGLALPFTSNSESERAAARLLANIVHDELFDRLRQQLGLIYGIDAEIVPYTDSGLIWLSATHYHRHARRLEREVNAVLDQLSAGEISERLLERTRASTLARWTMALQSNDACVETITLLPEIAMGQAPVLYHERLATVTIEEVRQAAKRLLARENRQWLVHRPSIIGTALALSFTILAVSGIVTAVLIGLKAWLR